VRVPTFSFDAPPAKADLQAANWQLAIGNWQFTLPRVSIYEELEWRGLIAQIAAKSSDSAWLDSRMGGPKLKEFPKNFPGLLPGMTLYCGFDPTADSLHVGNLVPLLALRRFQLFGHHPIAVAGGATGMVGDPSGKTQERQLLTPEVLAHNIARVKEQLKRLLDFDTKKNPARLMDNASWTANVSYLDFLRDIGKHFPVNQMVAKESVRARMADREAGISYTEFSYMLLQAFDFYVLCRDHNCELQIGGSDQWGNITAGIDLCRRKLGKTVYGLTLPLITNADGSKFGKTEAGAVWLAPKKTTPEDFYQFWIRTDDRDVIRYLKYFTFLPQDEIVALEKNHTENPSARVAHKALARAVTDLVHGGISDNASTSDASASTQGALLVASIIYEKSLEDFTEADFENLVRYGRSKEIDRNAFGGPGIHLAQLLFRSELSGSVGQAKKDLADRGIRVGSVHDLPPGQPPYLQLVINPRFPLKTSDLIFNRYLLLRKGKKNYVVVTAK
jgi:tyrosyl-tRNA synthetase